MKGMPFPFDFEGKGVLNLHLESKKNCFLIGKSNNYSSSFCEPTSVLDSGKFPSCPTSSSTLSSSLGGSGGGSCSGDANPSPKWPPQDSTTATSSKVAGGGAESELFPIPPSLEIGEKCAMEDWQSVLSESVAGSPSQEQSIFRWIMGDVEDKVLDLRGGAGGGSVGEYEFSGGAFGLLEQGFGGGDQFGVNFLPPSQIPSNFGSISEKIGSSNLPTNFLKFPIPNSQSTTSIMYPSNGPGVIGTTMDSCAEIKPSPIFNPQLLINQHQSHHTQNSSFFLPQQHQGQNNLFTPPPAKRHNPGSFGFHPGGPIPPHQLQLLPHYPQQRAMEQIGEKRKIGGDEYANFHQQEIIDQLYKLTELVQTGNNPVHMQRILARLNHQLSPIGKPFHRAAFYFKEALQSLIQSNNKSNFNSPFSPVYKIGAYKCFSEISPILQFANFTCTQALLEEFEAFDRIHIVDFDIGYGGQWASLMQELAIRPGGAPSLRISILASPSTHDQLELGLTRENLVQFASEISIPFEFDIISIDCLSSSSWTVPFHTLDNETVAVNLPISSLLNYQVPVPLVFRFVKQLSPRIILSIDRGCDRTDLPFSSHVIHALQSYANLLASLDAVNVNMEALQNIEKFMVQPGIEKIVIGRFRNSENTQHWRTMFLSSGFSPVAFSNFTESQAEFVAKRVPVRGFQVEKRQASLVLSWQQKELISVSAWRC